MYKGVIMVILFAVLTTLMAYFTVNHVANARYVNAAFSFMLFTFDAVILAGLLTNG